MPVTKQTVRRELASELRIASRTARDVTFKFVAKEWDISETP
jgi:hypothetical protein